MLPKGELKSEELSMCRHGPERAPETFVTNLVKLWTLEANQLVTTPTLLLVNSGQTRNSPYLHTRQNSLCVHSLRENFHVHQRTWCDTGPGPSFYNPVICLISRHVLCQTFILWWLCLFITLFLKFLSHKYCIYFRRMRKCK